MSMPPTGPASSKGENKAMNAESRQDEGCEDDAARSEHELDEKIQEEIQKDDPLQIAQSIEDRLAQDEEELQSSDGDDSPKDIDKEMSRSCEC